MANQAIDTENKRKDGVNMSVVVIGMVVVFGILFAMGFVPRLMHVPLMKAQTKAQRSAPIVNAIAVVAPPPTDTIDLPGNIQAIEQTAVVARSSGYVKKWMADIGDHVTAGQPLAVVETPDLDQQVIQARAQLSSSQAAYYQAKAALGNQQATLAQSKANLSHSKAALEQAMTQLSQARAALSQAQEQAAQQTAQVAQGETNLNLAKVTAERYKNLLADGAIDRQTTDQMVAAYDTNHANVDALKAALMASKSNVEAYTAAVGSARANVRAVADDIDSSRAAVAAAAANVRSAEANVTAASANIASTQANLDRYAVLQSFEVVKAPFSGVVTARNVDNGTLISAAGTPSAGSADLSGNGSNQAGVSNVGNPASGAPNGNGGSPSGSGSSGSGSMFSIAQLDSMRVYFNIPQAYIGTVRLGQPADVTVREIPGQTFHGVIARTAGALDASSRTLVAEVHLANPKGLLQPGMFADVVLTAPHPGTSLLVPDTALVTNAQGNQVVVVNSADSTIHFQPVTVGRDFGTVMEITSGLRTGQEIAASPSDALLEGEKVRLNHLPPTVAASLMGAPAAAKH